MQNLLGIKTFSDYGILTDCGELIFYVVKPTNISILSALSVESKIRQLMLVLSAIPDIEISCTDSSECFDDNKAYLIDRMRNEHNPKVRDIIKKDIVFLDSIQMEMSTAREFLFVARCRNMKAQQVFERANGIEKIIAEQGFDGHRMKKDEIKRFLGIYFDATTFGEHLPDYDGVQYFDINRSREELSDENGA